MRRSRKALTPDEIGTLIGLVAIVLGAGLYLYPPMLAGFPINDGGLFYTMIRAIQANGFRLPDYVQYNGLNIPFAYPPLGFYVGAAASTLLRIDPLIVLQWFPAVTLIGISVAFYFLAARILGSRIEAGIATFLYVCTPRSMTWLVMGGGITRGLGQLFLILTVTAVYALFTDGRRRYLVLSMITGALVIVTHPEAALHTVAVCALLWLWKGRNKRGVVHAALVGAGAAVLSAIWWLPKIAQFGIAPFVSAAQTGLHSSVVWIYPFFFTFTEEPTLGLIAALGLIGLVACLAKRQYFLPAWTLLPFVLEPRGAATVAIVPLAVEAAIAVTRVIYPSLRSAAASIAPAGTADAPGASPVLYVVATYGALFLMVMAIYADLQLSQIRLSTPDRDALAWVAANTPPSSKFLILTGETELFCDPVQEWFPVLTGRISETTIQGYEWQSNGGFFQRVARVQDLQRCLGSASPDCLQTRAPDVSGPFDYLYLQKESMTKQLCRAVGSAARGQALLVELRQDGRYSSIYSTDAVEIFSKIQGAGNIP